MRLTVSDGHWDDVATLTVTAFPSALTATESVPVLAIHDQSTLYGWQPWGPAADADSIILTNYPSLVAGWDAGDILATEITVEQQDVYHPERFQVVDGQVSQIP